MGLLRWIGEHWFDLVQTGGIIGGLLFTGFTIQKEERARKIGNFIAITSQYRDIWKAIYEQPSLSRILKKDVNLKAKPISDEETLFVKLLILHLDNVYRAVRLGMFVEVEGMQKDIKDFFSAPIPKNIWERLKPFQDKQFVEFVENSLTVE